MIVPLLHQWTKANALFKPPVINQCRTIELKLTKLWHKAVETSLGKGNLARKNEFLHTLDTLFDILTCKCSIQLCSESNCSHSGKRENNSHIDCGCPREKKIPVLELEFIKAQRTKAEGQGSMQMGSIDYSETKKQIANAKKREQIREREQKKKMKSEEAIQREEELCQDVYHFFDIPPINVNATKLSELVDLSLEVLEPPLTTSLTSQELRNLKETPMQVPKWPSHTQSVERCVKMVTEAAGHVYSHERREDKELINDMIVPLLHQWTKANALFKPPVINQCRTIELKLTKLWHRKNEFLHTLDTLFDILTCKCSIQLCSESNCSHSGKRENNSHIDCGCPREKKIPVLELEFIKAQRTKAEGQGSMQMGSIDYSETLGDCSFHSRKVPPINVNATKLSELVDLSLEVLEPPLTTSLTSQELRNLKETPMQVPKWPSHTQSVERCVKMVTEAAGYVYSHERREDKELINDMIVPLLHQWTKANALFKTPVINQCRTIELKLTKLWHKAVETSLGKGNLARKNEFLHTLDTLFDILTCKCSIQLCSESNCSHSGKRENNSHIDCGCPREKKIPVLELEFIKAQRTKAEGQGSMQMGSIGYSETKKQIANAKKREQI
ncbi:hypothetical protein Hamer_G027326, partial [Homarus americanus]